MNLLFLILENVLALQTIAASSPYNGCHANPRKTEVLHRKIHATLASRHGLTRRREIHAASRNSRGIMKASRNSRGIRKFIWHLEGIAEFTRHRKIIRHLNNWRQCSTSGGNAKFTRHREIHAAEQANAVRRRQHTSSFPSHNYLKSK